MSTINKFIETSIKYNGASYSVNTGEINPDTGYMVSLQGHECKLPILDTLGVVQYIKDVSERLITDECYIGSWFNEQDELWYLDVSVQVDNLEEAFRIARENKQIAFWDCERKVLKYTHQ